MTTVSFKQIIKIEDISNLLFAIAWRSYQKSSRKQWLFVWQEKKKTRSKNKDLFWKKIFEKVFRISLPPL